MLRWAQNVWQARRLDLPYLHGGQVSRRGIYVYTKGDCWHLAHQLARMTGWTPVYLISKNSALPSAERWSFCHALVRTPSGDLLDVRGLQSEQEVRARWGSRVYHDLACQEEIEERLADPPAAFQRRTLAVAQHLLDNLSPSAFIDTRVPLEYARLGEFSAFAH